MRGEANQPLPLPSTILYVARHSDTLAMQCLHILENLGKSVRTLADDEYAPDDSCALFSVSVSGIINFPGTYLRTTTDGIVHSNISIPHFAKTCARQVAVNATRLKQGETTVVDDREQRLLSIALASMAGCKSPHTRTRKKKSLEERRLERHQNWRTENGLAA